MNIIAHETKRFALYEEYETNNSTLCHRLQAYKQYFYRVYYLFQSNCFQIIEQTFAI